MNLIGSRRDWKQFLRLQVSAGIFIIGNSQMGGNYKQKAKSRK
jgi:hypothetical protein